MKKLLRSFGVISSVVFATALFLPALQSPARVPLPPQTGEGITAAPASTTPAISTLPAELLRIAPPSHPVRLRIPSLSLDDAVVAVGVNDKGEMDVPDGSTSDVGWYKYGTVPGENGSAVMDAHVFAAFADLKRVRAGDEIDVEMSNGDTLKFKVSKTAVYPLSQVPAEDLFNTSGGRYLSLITCAGSLVPDHSTYDHRLIVYAALDES